MEKLKFTFGGRAASAMLGIMLASVYSCVDKDYDLSKDIDVTATLLKNAALPVGSVSKIYLKDLLLGEDEALLEVTAEGNYKLKFADGNVREQITVPAFASEAFTHSSVINLPAADASPVSSGENALGIADMGTMRLAFKQHTDQVPEVVTGIYSCNVDSGLTLVLSSSSAAGSVRLVGGSSLVFPDFLVLGSSVPSGLKKTGKNTFELADDMPLYPPLEFNFDITSLDFNALPSGQGLVRPGSLEIDSEVILSGAVKFSLASMDSDIKITGTLEAREMRFLSAEASIDMETDISLSPFEIGGVPDFLTGDGAILDLRGFRLDMSVDNTFPAGGTITAGIRTIKNSSSVADALLGPVNFSASSLSSYSFSQAGTGAPDGYSNVKTDDFDGLLKLVPDVAELRDFKALTDNKPIKVEFGTPYYMDVKYSLGCPLCFGNEMSLDFTQDITDLNVDMSDLSLNSVQLTLDVINSIPLGFVIEAVATDAEGNVMPGVTVLLDGDIRAGSIDTPVKSELSIKLSARSGPVSFAGLRLFMSAASGNTANTLIPLNIGQGLEISGLVLRLPEGITLDLGGE